MKTKRINWFRRACRAKAALNGMYVKFVRLRHGRERAIYSKTKPRRR